MLRNKCFALIAVVLVAVNVHKCRRYYVLSWRALLGSMPRDEYLERMGIGRGERVSRWLETRCEVSAVPTPGRRTTTPPEGLAVDLERAIAALPPRAREAFVLHDVEGYRHREIAEMTGVTAGTVKSQLHRARRLLRQKLGDAREETR